MLECVTCHGEIEPGLERLGAIECHDCRDGSAAGEHRSSRVFARGTTVTETTGSRALGAGLTKRIHPLELEGSTNGAPVAYLSRFVRPDHCLHCGHKLITWSPQRILEAIRDWNATHGRPPGMNDWRTAAVDHPAVVTVVKMFGRWNTAIAAAGFEPRDPFSVAKWDEESIIAAILDFLLLHNRWPTIRDFNKDERWPSFDTVRRYFGSWSGGLRAAGRTAHVAGGRTWVDGRRKKRARRAAPAEVGA